MHLGNAYCRHCGDTIETTMHVLRDCPMTMMVWVRIVDVDIRNQFFNVNLENWLYLNLNFSGSVNAGKWPELWSITCHYLWMYGRIRRSTVRALRDPNGCGSKL